MSSQWKGDWCELVVMAKAIRQGHEVSIPFGQTKGFDFLVKVEGYWQEWQIKTAKIWTAKNGSESVHVDLRRKNKNSGKNTPYRKNDFDYLIAVDPASKRMWRLPVTEVQGRRHRTFAAERFVWE